MQAIPLIAAVGLTIPGMAGLAAGIRQLAGRVPDLLAVVSGFREWLDQTARISDGLVLLAGGLAILILAGMLAWTALQSRAGARNRHHQ